MDDICRMHVSEAFQDLEHEVFYMVEGELLLRVDHAMQVRLHQLRYDVDVVVAFSGLGFQQVRYSDYVLVFEEF